ncbi:MAG: amino acid permease-associated region, partial [Fusobacteriales bacterium]|nr:amino acid permease-associated region [Fusobacteriales bacterium]
MSGDLKNPKKDIPKGTFWAIGITFLIYLFQAFWFSKNISVDASMDKLILVRNGVTKFPIIVILGIWAATLSSALGSIIAAPRTMQALARDGVLP